MSDLETLYSRNATFVESFDKGDLPVKPGMSTIIVTCVDARVDPAHYAGLELGDALVLRTAGGRVTDGIVTEVNVLWQLMKLVSGQDPMLSVAVIQHTNCGMARFANPQAAEALEPVLGADVLATYAIGDPDEAVRGDVVKALEGGPEGLTVSGHMYDVATGALREIVPLTN